MMMQDGAGTFSRRRVNDCACCDVPGGITPLVGHRAFDDFIEGRRRSTAPRLRLKWCTRLVDQLLISLGESGEKRRFVRCKGFDLDF